ncbi:hypothetical protein ACFQY0_12510 [Haloferula chungangensis]|uniref:Uncharacterized protein n=1 Tax=Haloferula chungangensis TaxID=1048331 RepID=A0ABW2L929_9BACT
MKVPLFVTCSAAFLVAWLGVTFFREVPRDAYPQLGKGSLPVSAKTEKKELLIEPEEPKEVVAAAE